jgi:NHL repeat
MLRLAVVVRRLFPALLILFSLFADGGVVVVAQPDDVADAVLGQGGSFCTNDINKGGRSASALSGVSGLAVGPGMKLLAADRYNNRILRFPKLSPTATSAQAERQWGSANMTDMNTFANFLNDPYAVASDPSGGVYIADRGDNRVLYFGPGASDGTSPDRVYGPALCAGCGSLHNPSGVSAGQSGGVFISDTDNHRVLFFAGTETVTPSRVYGQGGDFTTTTVNKGGRSADSLRFPHGVSASTGGLYVADRLNNRVLYFSGTSTTATRVYGQGGDFTAAGNRATQGISKSSLYQPQAVSRDRHNGVFIADTANNRVLHYEGTSTDAVRVYGQFGSFSAFVATDPSAQSITRPVGLAVDPDFGLYVSSSSRVLVFRNGTSFLSAAVCASIPATTADIVAAATSGSATEAASALPLILGLAGAGVALVAVLIVSIFVLARRRGNTSSLSVSTSVPASESESRSSEVQYHSTANVGGGEYNNVDDVPSGGGEYNTVDDVPGGEYNTSDVAIDGEYQTY